MVNVKEIEEYILYVIATQTKCRENVCITCKIKDICDIYILTVDKLLKEGVY